MHAPPLSLPRFTRTPLDPRRRIRTHWNRPAMPESRKHPQEWSITGRSGQQYPGEIAAGGRATPEGLPGKEYAKEQNAYEKPHAKTQNCSPFSATESTNTQPRICPCSRPVHPNLLPADAPEFIARRDSYHARGNPAPLCHFTLRHNLSNPIRRNSPSYLHCKPPSRAHISSPERISIRMPD